MASSFRIADVIRCVSLRSQSLLSRISRGRNSRYRWPKDFRIETKIYVGDEERSQPSETTTLFLDGVVYDFLAKPAQTAVFRKPTGGKPGRFILLDRQAAHPHRDLDRATGRRDGQAANLGRSSRPIRSCKFAANPEFEESFEPDSGQLVLASHWRTTRSTTTPAEHPEALAEYREFLDWYTQLNTLLSGGPPPEPRLRAERSAGAPQGRAAEGRTDARRRKEPLRAEHDFTWRLSQDDMRTDRRRARVAGQLSRRCDNEEFLQSDAADEREMSK